MDYNTLIEETRQKLKNYTFDDSIYNEIYDRAYSSLRDTYAEEDAAINNSYAQSRRKAVGENALTTKNLSEELAVRGLARSGESALLRINQGISLNNTLAELAESKLAAHSELSGKREEAVAELQKDIAEKKADAMENERSALYDRLEHLESLKAADEEWRSKLYAESKETQSGTTDTSQEGSQTTSGLKGLLSPIINAVSKFVSNAGGTYVTPNISPSTMANNIADRYANSYGYISDADQEEVYKDLAMVISTSKLDEDYAADVLTALRSLGFTKAFSVKQASKPYMRSAFNEYASVFNDTYYKLKDEGYSADDANKYALEAAEEAVYKVLDRNHLSSTEYTNALLMLGLK